MIFLHQKLIVSEYSGNSSISRSQETQFNYDILDSHRPLGGFISVDRGDIQCVSIFVIKHLTLYRNAGNSSMAELSFRFM